MLSELLMDQREGERTGRHREISSKIHHVGNSLLEIINSYLNYSKALSNGIKADRSYVDLNTLRSSLEGMFYAKSRLKELTFRWSMDDQFSGRVYTDRFLVKQILKNLLSNAFKYTRTGGVEMAMSFCPMLSDGGFGETGNRVQAPDGDSDKSVGNGASDREGSDSISGILTITVSDTGIGISEEKQQAIFEKYQQVEAETQFVFGGTGLGLSIAQKAAELLEGEITLESEPGKGSTFTFSHPVRLLSEERTGSDTGAIYPDSDTFLSETTISVQDEETSYDFKRNHDNHTLRAGQRRVEHAPGTLLLIDDSPLHSQALKEYLEPSVERVLQARTAEMAYRTLEKFKVDTVILDMTLPDASGEEVLKRIRESHTWGCIPVIIYTGLPLSDRRLKQPRKSGIPIITKSVNSYRKLKSVILGMRTIDSTIKTELD